MNRAFRIQYGRITVLSLCLLLFGAVLLAGSVAGQSVADGTIEGTVENEIGDGIEDATVNITGNSSLETTTDSNGDYRIENIPYGEHDLAVGHSDYDNTSRTVEVSTTNSPVTEDFTLGRTTGTLQGEVSASASSNPISGTIPGATVEITHEEDQDLIEGTGLSTSTTTDGNGDYSIEVPTGNVTVTINQDGYEENATDVNGIDDTGATQDVLLDAKLGSLSGSVENDDGDRLPDAAVSVTDDTSIWPNITSSDLSTQTDSNGEYTIDNVPNSTVGESRTVEADASTFEPSETTVEIDGATTYNFTLTHEPGSVTGTIQDSNGNALNGITVDVSGAGEDTTGTDGSYEITEVPFGTHELTVDHPDYERETKEIEVQQGQANTEDITISRETPVDLTITESSPGLAQSGDQVTVTYSFDETVHDTIEFTVDGRQQLVDRTLNVGYNGVSDEELTFTIPDNVEDGQYSIRLESLGTTESTSVTVSNAINPDAIGELAPPVYSPAGEFVDITTGGEYMIVGGSKEPDESNPQQYLDILRVNGGSTTLNTRLVGTDVSSERAYGSGVTSYAHSIGADSEPTGEFEDITFEDKNGNEIASTLAEFRSEIGVGARSAPLQADRYRLVAGENGRIIIEEDGEPDFRRPVGRSSFVLTQNHHLGEVTTYVAPPGDIEGGGLPGDAVESDFVAKGERVYITVPAVGMWGAMLESPDEELTADHIETLLQRDEGVHMDLSVSRYGSPNSKDATLQFEESNDLEVSLSDEDADWDSDTLGDPPNFEGFIIGIDTRGSEPFTNQPQDGDRLEFEIEYQSPDGERFRFEDYAISDGEQPAPFTSAVSPNDGVGHFPYFGPSDTTISSNASFEYQELSIRYARTHPNGDLFVPAQSDGQIIGSTTMAPGSQATIEIIASEGQDPEPITINDVTVDDDRRFATSADFSSLEPGQEAEVAFYAQNRLLDNRIVDKRTVQVVDDIENPVRFEVESAPENVTIQQRESMGDIEATIRNTGSIVGRQVVNITVDGESIKEESIILGSNQSTTVDLSGQFVTLPIGTYEYTVKTENDEATGQLTVTPPDSGTTITSADSDAATSSSPLGEDEMPSDGDDSEDGLFGLLGIRSRDVVVATAVTGAVHVLGYWA